MAGGVLRFSDLPLHLRKVLVEDGECWVTANGRDAGHTECWVPAKRGRVTVKRAAWEAMKRPYKRFLSASCGRVECVRHLESMQNSTQVANHRLGVSTVTPSCGYEARILVKSLIDRGFKLDRGEGPLPVLTFRINGPVIEFREEPEEDVA